MHKQATRELLEKELHFVLSAIDLHKLLSQLLTVVRAGPYVWIVIRGSNLAAVTQYCFCGPYSQVIGFFILPFQGTAVIISDLCFNKWLVKDPAVRNLIKIIFQVLRYAIKTTTTSLFTHWEDEPYSWLD